MCKFSSTILVLLLNTLKALLFKEYPTKKPSVALVSDIQEKDKNNGKTDKAEHENEKSMENQSRK
ncbi:hypothetical protein Tco_1270585, partial [Tanacetum coccineum]